MERIRVVRRLSLRRISHRRSNLKLSIAGASPLTIADPVLSARVAGLHYVSDEEPGIRRIRSGDGFRYIGPKGKAVRDPQVLARIRSLVIPPAWQQVWICRSASGHLQATGLDSRGRKQYRYHPRWREVRDRTKFHRMLAFGRALPRIRARVRRDLARPGLSRPKLVATIVRLLETTLIRVGNDEYARENHSFGLTTLRNRHVRVSGPTVHFTFRGKAGIQRAIDLRDRRLARIIRQCQEIPGHELFQYRDESGKLRRVTSTDINEYLQQITGQDFTAKDFRTWAGTVLAARALQPLAIFASPREARRNIVQAVAEVGRKLGNTPAVCRKCYIHPAVIDTYQAGELPRALSVPVAPRRGLSTEEAAVLAFLREHSKRPLLRKSG